MRTRLALVLATVLVVRAGIVDDVRVLGAAAQPLLVVAAAGGAAGGAQQGAVIGFVAGLLADLFLQTPLGLSALAYTVVGYLVGRLEAGVVRSAWWIPVSTCAVASAVGVVLFAVAGAMLGFTHLVTPRLAVVATVVAALNGLLALAIVPAMRWALAEPAPTRAQVG